MRLEELPYIMIRCLVLTITLEVLVGIILHVRKKDLLNIVFANVITNPIVVVVPVYINITYGLMQRHITLLILEILTVFVEGFIYKKFNENKKNNPYKISIILNLSSYLIGLIINYI